jgi:hypothetical protein
MPSHRRPSPRPNGDRDDFEDFVTASLEAQDKVLEKLELKLERPVMNGGFDKLVEKVEKIESVTEQLQRSREEDSKKITAIHEVVLDPDTGLYHKVKSNSQWIDTASRSLKWFLGFLGTGALAGLGKLLYDFLAGHIHFTP